MLRPGSAHVAVDDLSQRRRGQEIAGYFQRRNRAGKKEFREDLLPEV